MDASDYGLGAMLSQIHLDSTERVSAFASRVLTDAEKKYSTVEKEALACGFAVEHLWGRKFTLRTSSAINITGYKRHESGWLTYC